MSLPYRSGSAFTGLAFPQHITDSTQFADEHGEGRERAASHGTWSQAAKMCWMTQRVSLRASGVISPVGNGIPPEFGDLFSLNSVDWSFGDADWSSAGLLVPTTPGPEFTLNPNALSVNLSLTKQYEVGTIAGRLEMDPGEEPYAVPIVARITCTWRYDLPDRYTSPPLTEGVRWWPVASAAFSATVGIADGYGTFEDNDLLGGEPPSYTTVYLTGEGQTATAAGTVAVYLPWQWGYRLPSGSNPPEGTPSLSVPLGRLPGVEDPAHGFTVGSPYIVPVTTYGKPVF